MSRSHVSDLLAGPDSPLPPARRLDASHLVEAALPGQSFDGIQPIHGGASGAEIYKLTGVPGQAFVLRLDGPPDGFRDPARQYECQRIAAEAGVAPALTLADSKARISLSAFVEATPFAMARQPRLEALGRAIGTLHAAPLFPALMPYFDAMGMLLRNFASSDILPLAISRDMLALHNRIAEVYPHSADDLVSSHNDLNPGNLIFTGEQAVIVDWESAFAADRYVDLSAALNFFTTHAEEEGWLLQAYFGRKPDQAEREKILLMRQVNRLFYAAMLISAAARQQPGLRLDADGLALHGLSRLRAEGLSAATVEGKIRLGGAFMNEAFQVAQSATFRTVLQGMRERRQEQRAG